MHRLSLNISLNKPSVSRGQKRPRSSNVQELRGTLEEPSISPSAASIGSSSDEPPSKAVRASSLQCTYSSCEKVYRDRRSLERHEKTHSTSRYGCDVCGCEFDRRDTLTRHSRIHDKEQSASYHCRICKQDFSRKDHYMEHSVRGKRHLQNKECKTEQNTPYLRGI